MKTATNDDWDMWVQSLRHESIETIRDAVEELMYESIEHGCELGPNGITHDGMDEGIALTDRAIGTWVERFATLGRGTCRTIGMHNGFIELSCGDMLPWASKMPPRYCPNCGRQVVDE